MKVRIISALVGIVILVGVLLCPYTIALAIVAAVLAAIAVWELLYNTGYMKNLVQVIGGMLVSAFGVLGMYYAKTAYNNALFNSNAEAFRQWKIILMAVPLLYGIFTLLIWAISSKTISFNRACYAFLMTLYPAVGFGCMVMLRETPNLGMWLLVLLLMIAFVSDTGAYFVGTFLGKHKMAPKISPKKSWEGFFGGWIISVLCAVGLFILRANMVSLEGLFYSLRLFLPTVIILAPLSVAGDLFASLIKRKCGIKDYGNLMPGHGGVMDRFDSVLFIAPLLWLVSDNTQAIANFFGI